MKKAWLVVALLLVAVGVTLAYSPEPYQSVYWDAVWDYLNYISPEQYQSCYVGK